MAKFKSSYEEKYRQEVVPALMKQFNYQNIMQVPRLEKIVVNSSLAEALQNAKVLETASSELMTITGQKPVITTARKSIANFKLREGQKLGVCVTLRKAVMYEFLNRLCNVALPRVRDFRGVSGRSFDGRGNYSLGITEQIIFPEINYDKIDKIRGMNITIVTTAKTDEEGKALLKSMGVPFRN
jgi:large subunit ribosomal protein L5